MNHSFSFPEPILREKLMSGRVLIQWRHSICAEIARSRYMNPDSTRAVHTEIANIFFQQEQDDSDEISSEQNSDVKTSGNLLIFIYYFNYYSFVFDKHYCLRI